MLVLGLAASEPHDPAEVSEQAGILTKQLGVQTQLPQAPSAEPPPAVHRSSGFSTGGEGVSIPPPAAVFSLLQWVAVAIAVIAVLALAAIVVRERMERKPKRSVSGAKPEPVAQDAPPKDPPTLLSRADELAAEGRYLEAMHYVLLVAMAIVGGSQERRLADSLTSWELLRAPSLAPPQQEALRDVVLRVERAWFGKGPADPGDYRYVRGRFDEFAAMAKGAA
jgi:hypothetical protein